MTNLTGYFLLSQSFCLPRKSFFFLSMNRPFGWVCLKIAMSFCLSLSPYGGNLNQMDWRLLVSEPITKITKLRNSCFCFLRPVQTFTPLVKSIFHMCYVQDTSRDPFARSVKQSFAISSNRIVGCTSTPKIPIKTTKASVHSYCITYFVFLEFEPNHPTQLTMREAASIEAKQPTHRAKGSVRANQRPRHLDTNQAYRGQEDKKQRAEVEVLQKLPQRREQI